MICGSSARAGENISLFSLVSKQRSTVIGTPCRISAPLAGIFLEKLLRGGKIEIFVSKGGHACVRVHALIVCVPVLIINVCVPA